MNTNQTIYLSYTDADNVPPFFQTLDGKAGLALVKASAGIMGRVATLLHTRSGQDGDPPIEIVCITDTGISGEVAEAVSQAAVNYAMETGLIPMKRGDRSDDEPNNKRGGEHGFSPS